MDLRDFVRDVPDFPKPGILFKDITPLLASPKAFRQAIDALTAHYRESSYDVVAAAEARGFLFAAPLALLTKKPFVPLRKPGKLPYKTRAHAYDLEYGRAELHMHVDGISPGSRVLLVDDLLATGGTMLAACKLVEEAGGTVIGLAFLIELLFLEGRKKLEPKPVHSLIAY